MQTTTRHKYVMLPQGTHIERRSQKGILLSLDRGKASGIAYKWAPKRFVIRRDSSDGGTQIGVASWLFYREKFPSFGFDCSGEVMQ